MGVLSIVHWLISYVFPERADAALVRSLNAPLMRTLVSRQSIPHGTALLRYGDPRVRALIHEAKYFRNETALALLGTILKQELLQYQVPYTVVPVPLSYTRQRERGYNQVTAVIRVALEGTPHRLHTSLLVRTKHTPPQTKLTKRERERNLANAFRVTAYPLPQHILLVDDVTTTGSTLRECRDTLLQAGAHDVHVISLAH